MREWIHVVNKRQVNPSHPAPAMLLKHGAQVSGSTYGEERGATRAEDMGLNI